MLSPPLLRLLLTLLSSFLLAGGEPDLNSDAAALLALRIAVGRIELQWNATDSPCVWHGVSCRHNRVVFLRLPALRLIGEIPTGTLGNLTALRTLSLPFNTLSGSLPPDFTNAANLRRLYLQNNRFSGTIPPALFSLQNLTHLNLAGNGFTGGISPEFNNLFRLELVCLERNQLGGGIPDLDLPKLAEFNVSFNRLSGSLPSKLWKMPASGFVGTELCDGPLIPCSRDKSLAINPEVAGDEGGSVLSGGAIAGIVIGSAAAAAAVLVASIVFLFVCRSKVAETPVAALKKAGIGKRLVFFGCEGEREFDLEDLLRASTEVLGKGKMGAVYKAELEVGRVVAVKRLRDATLKEEEFREKIEELGRMRHENVVPLRACYCDKNEKMLVYDYMPMGSLSALLHGNKKSSRTTLNWETRVSIALSTAHGISYIHSRSPAASHGNIKSSNIFLKEAHKACVSDNGLVALINPSSHASAYGAPEVTDFRKISQKADIYSFGVLLLELLTGRSPKEGVNLPKIVQLVLREEWSTDVLDLELLGQQNVEEMVQLLQIALNCTVEKPDCRPCMQEVIEQIELIDLCRPVQVREQQVQLDEESGDEAGSDQAL